MIDVRRETGRIFKEFDRYHNVVGEGIIWFKFDLDSSYDRVYDEGGRNYLPGVAVPVLWVDQVEDPETYTPEGRRPTQRIRLAVSAQALLDTGIDATEAHGGRNWDEKPTGKPWWDDRLNDLLYYDGRFYEVSNFQIRGRAKQADVVVGVSGIETQPSDERIWDLFPGLPPTVTSVSPAEGVHGVDITITGTGFTGATAITMTWGDTYSIAVDDFTVVSSTEITAVTPMGVPSGTTVDVRVTTSFGTSAVSDGDVYYFQIEG